MLKASLQSHFLLFRLIKSIHCLWIVEHQITAHSLEFLFLQGKKNTKYKVALHSNQQRLILLYSNVADRVLFVSIRPSVIKPSQKGLCISATVV